MRLPSFDRCSRCCDKLLSLPSSPVKIKAPKIKDGSYSFHQENTELSLAKITSTVVITYYEMYLFFFLLLQRFLSTSVITDTGFPCRNFSGPLKSTECGTALTSPELTSSRTFISYFTLLFEPVKVKNHGVVCALSSS